MTNMIDFHSGQFKLHKNIICCFCSFFNIFVNLTLIIPIFEHEKQKGDFSLDLTPLYNPQLSDFLRHS